MSHIVTNGTIAVESDYPELAKALLELAVANGITTKAQLAAVLTGADSAAAYKAIIRCLLKHFVRPVDVPRVI